MILSNVITVVKKMKGSYIDSLINKYCKIVTTKPGEERAHVVFGMVINIDHNAGFIFIESNPGLMCLNIESIVSIKPRNKKD